MKKTRKTNFVRYVSGANRIITYVVANHLWMEHILLRCLDTVLKKPQALSRNGHPSFSALISLCEAYGFIEDDFANVLRKANSLRNRYAHRLAFEPEAREVRKLLKACASMRQPFLIDRTPPTQRSMMRALAGISGYLERRALEIGARVNDRLQVI
jgi:hypothetical protein